MGGNRRQNRNADRSGKGLRLTRAIVLVDHQTGHTHIAAELAEVLHRRTHIVGHIQRLQIIRPDHDHLLAHVTGNRQAEAATHHIAEKIQQHIVEIPVMESELLERLEAMDDAATTTTTPDLRAAELHRIHAIALEADITDGDLLTGRLLGRTGGDDRRAGTPPEQQRGGVALGVAADQQDLLALLGHHVGQIGQGETLADAALAVDRDDLGFLGRRRGRHRIRVDRGLGQQGHLELMKRIRPRLSSSSGMTHCTDLQSNNIFRQAGSAKAVW